MNRIINQMSQRMGLDRAVKWTLLTQASRFITGPITMILMVRYLTPEIQGYAYTFLGVLGLSVFLELGFSQNILQFTAHEFSKLKLTSDRRLEGDEEALSRLVSLGRLSFKYYGIASGVFLLFLLIGGHWFFSTEDAGVAWRIPWVVASVSSAFSLLISPCWALIEGCNQIASIERFRFYLSIGVFIMTALLMVIGQGLYALVVPAAVSFGVSVLYLAIGWDRFFSTFNRPPSGGSISWKEEIWPYQWRIGISWMSGYFIFNLITPVVFRLAGASEAGRFGFTLQLVRLVAQVASSWSTTKLPLYGILVAKRDWNEMNRVWSRVTKTTLLVATIGSIGLIVFMSLATRMFPSLDARYAGASVAAILCISMICQCFTASGAYFLRAFKMEPYMRLSIVNAVLAAILIPSLGYFWGMFGATLGYALAIIALTVPAYRLFIRKRQEFTAEA